MICNLTRIVSNEIFFSVVVLSCVVSLYLFKLNKFFPFLKPRVVNYVDLIIELTKESILILLIFFLKWSSFIIYLLLQIVEFLWVNYQYIFIISWLNIKILVVIKKAMSYITASILVLSIELKSIIFIILVILVIGLFIHCSIGVHYL